MDAAIEWVKNNTNTAVTLMNVVIGLVAVIFIAVLVIKAIKNFGSKKGKEGSMDLVYALIVVIIATVSILGVIKLGKMLKPDSVEGNNSFGALGVPGESGGGVAAAVAGPDTVLGFGKIALTAHGII